MYVPVPFFPCNIRNLSMKFPSLAKSSTAGWAGLSLSLSLGGGRGFLLSHDGPPVCGLLFDL